MQKERTRDGWHAKNILTTTSFVLYYDIVFKFRGTSCGGLKKSDHTINFSSESKIKFKALDPQTLPECRLHIQTLCSSAMIKEMSCTKQYTFFFYKQPHFPVEPRVAIGNAQNEAQNCYEVANVFWRLQAEISKNRGKQRI